MASPPEASLPEEDRARAQCYALVSRLFYGPPDADLLAELARSSSLETGGASSAAEGDSVTGYAQALNALQRVSAASDVEALRQQYDDLFAGAGKALVSPYTSGYVAPHGPDRHLLALREQLAAWGLARRSAVFEVEDHVSAVCDVMRWLIERDSPVAEQRAFFETFVSPGVAPCCDAVETRAKAEFYRAVARYALAVLVIERAAFDMDDSE